MAIRPSTNTDYTGITSSYVDDTKFIPELYSKKVLKNFYISTIYKDCFNTDYEGEIKGQGSKVHIRKTPEINVTAYSVGDELTYQVPTKDATELNVDQGFYSAFQVDDVNKAQADIDLINMFAADAAERIKIAVDAEVLAYISPLAAATNQGNTAGAISGSYDLGALAGTGTTKEITEDNAVDFIVELGAVLSEANIPTEGRFLILPVWFTALLQTGDLQRADVTGDSTGVIRTGAIGKIANFTIYESNNLLTATDGDGDAATYVIAGTKEACTFASQVDKVDTLKIEKSFGEYWRTLFIYGRAVVQPTALAVGVVKRG